MESNKDYYSNEDEKLKIDLSRYYRPILDLYAIPNSDKSGFITFNNEEIQSFKRIYQPLNPDLDPYRDLSYYKNQARNQFNKRFYLTRNGKLVSVKNDSVHALSGSATNKGYRFYQTNFTKDDSNLDNS